MSVKRIDALPEDMVDRFIPPDTEPGACEHIQTHISHLFLTRSRVYKIRKAVAFPFLSFATLAERNADCVRELELNRRLSPDVYLGIAPVVRCAKSGSWTAGPLGEGLAPPERKGEATSEHCVVMRRLPDAGDALSLLERGVLEARHVDAVARRIAGFHRAHRLGQPAPFSPEQWIERTQAPVMENLALIRKGSESAATLELVASIEAACRSLLAERSDDFERRRRMGLAVDGHGDLQLSHVWFEGDHDEPLIIDCTEFNEDFRRIDGASEVAFFAMDLRYRGRQDLAEHFVARYARDTDDFDLYRVLDYYLSYRAAVRAKVAQLATEDDEISPEQRKAAARSLTGHLSLARDALEARPPGKLILTCGRVGSGKSSVASFLADRLGGAVVSSDRTRKQLAGLAPGDRPAAAAEPMSGIYDEDHSDRVYAGLRERALPIVESGRVAILDATFARRDRREAMAQWAEERNLEALLVECRCDRGLTLERLAKREREGRDPSDAGPELYDYSDRSFEPTDSWPDGRKIVVDTGSADWRSDLEQDRRLPPPPGP
ncbi:MAG: AAA family ATPase [Deltaproteobacteria bacterium]|nr:AAA family ATPase [Deltaproteobacteria bacterium]